MSTSMLSGQVAVVTGASQGIGQHLALALSRHGAAVVGVARSRARLVAAMEAIATDTGMRTLALDADVTDAGQVDAAVAEAADRFGPIDLLVNCAGLVDEAEVPLWDADADRWWSVLESHVRGAQLLARAVLPAMVTRGRGRVINLASGMGTRAEPDYSAYSVGKAAQIRLTECLAESLVGTGVSAFNIAPGLVRTDMTAGMPRWAAHTAWTPAERVVELVCAVAAGELDQWSGRFLRAGVDDPAVVASLSPSGPDRQLRLRSYGADDPLA
ncbi:SDR family oxidoreductase [Lapillicoccus sp.]|uniref:SDR family NAD(P)-dependent oxidoreductase n=1 Tax=Lapillicoccus sp. TaxID=1909287 RepID=UPI0025E435E5|nr:SDR family oxidoreductase [Lapillicoccus sp.]